MTRETVPTPSSKIVVVYNNNIVLCASLKTRSTINVIIIAYYFLRGHNIISVIMIILQ